MPPTDDQLAPRKQSFVFSYMDDEGRLRWFEVAADWAKLGRLAVRASRNKSGRATLGRGLIVVTSQELVTWEEPS